MIFEIAKYAAAIATITGVLATFIKYAVVSPIKAYIDIKTYPIQNYANGSKSLPDAIKHLETINADIQHIKIRLDRLELDTPPF